MGFFKKIVDRGLSTLIKTALSPLQTIKDMASKVQEQVIKVVTEPFTSLVSVARTVRDKVFNGLKWIDENGELGVADTYRGLEHSVGRKRDHVGTALDGWIAQIFRPIHDAVKPPLADEDPLLGEERRAISDALGKADSHLDRARPATGSDLDVERREKAAEARFASSITTIQNIKLSEASLSIGDNAIADQIRSAFKQSSGLIPQQDQVLQDDAMRRAIYFSRNEKEVLPPYRYYRFVPESEAITHYHDHTLPTNPDELSRIIKKEDKGNGLFDYQICEPKGDYLGRSRSVQGKRTNLVTNEICFSFDLQDQDYPFDGKPETFLTKIKAHPQYQEALRNPHTKIGVGIYRSQTKIYVLLLMECDPSIPNTAKAPKKEVLDNKAWFDKVPPEYRRKTVPVGDPNQTAYSLQQLYDGVSENEPLSQRKVTFSGYSIYLLYDFLRNVEALGKQGLEVKALELELHPEETLGRNVHDVLHIKLQVGQGQPEMIKLISHTNVVVISRDASSQGPGGGSAHESAGGSITLDEYFARVRDSAPKVQEAHKIYTRAPASPPSPPNPPSPPGPKIPSP